MEPETRKWRLLDLLLVLGVAFSSAILASTYVFFNNSMTFTPEQLKLRLLNGFATELLALAVLAYVLKRNNRRWIDLGLDFRVFDILVSIALTVAMRIAFTATYYAINYGYYWMFNATLAHPKLVTVIHVGVTTGTILFVTLNPFFEELLARAFLMTEVKALTRSSLWAVIMSTVLQTTYHLYQGIDLALSLGAGFLLLSLYFARYKRAWPIILAHFYLDLIALLFYV